MLRGILSVVAGFVLWTLLRFAFVAILKSVFPGAIHEDGTTESSVVLLVFIALSVLFSIVSGYLTGIVAATNQVKHAFRLGIVLLAVGLVFEITGWTMAPVWYHIVFLILLLPAAVYGGVLRGGSRSRRRRAGA